MDLALQLQYARYALPAVVLATVFLVALLIAILVTHHITRNRCWAQIDERLDFHTREQISKWKQELSLKTRECEQLRARSNQLAAMIRGAMGSLSGIEAETKEKSE